jgi:hypothetical protein
VCLHSSKRSAGTHQINKPVPLLSACHRSNDLRFAATQINVARRALDCVLFELLHYTNALLLFRLFRFPLPFSFDKIDEKMTKIASAQPVKDRNSSASGIKFCVGEAAPEANLGG